MGNFATIVVDHSFLPRLSTQQDLGRKISICMSLGGKGLNEPGYGKLVEDDWAMLHHESCNRNHVPICFERGTFWAINEGERTPSLKKKPFSFYTLFGVVGDTVQALENDKHVGELLWHAATRPDAFPVNTQIHPSSCLYVGPTVSSRESGVIVVESDTFWNFLTHFGKHGLDMPEGSQVRASNISAGDQELLKELATAEMPTLNSKRVQRLLRQFRGYYG